MQEQLRDLGACEQCGGDLRRPPTAPHKRFCCERCRNEWHSARRKAAETVLREREAAEGKTDAA